MQKKTFKLKLTFIPNIKGLIIFILKIDFILIIANFFILALPLISFLTLLILISLLLTLLTGKFSVWFKKKLLSINLFRYY